MKLLTRMMALLSFFVMFQYANAAGNSVYVEQIGSAATINFTQTGTSNEIGNATTKATVNGNNNTVTIDQIGNNNVAKLNVDGTGATIYSMATGDNNAVDISCGSGGTCGASQITNNITGDGNSVTQSSDGLTISTVNVNSDNNTVSITNTSTAVSGSKSSVDISTGGGNTVGIIQTGAAGANGHDADVTVVGATNNVDIRQGGSVDSKVITTVTGSGNSLSVKSNHN